MSKKSRSGKNSKSARASHAAPYENALLAVENHERPSTYPGLTAETRRAASKAQFFTFAGMYSYDWRHIKIRLYRHLLEERELLVESERPRLTLAGRDPEVVVYQEATNGLLSSAASEFCQYAEDLAVLIRACGSDDFFARDIASASAGKMQSAVKAWATVGLRQAADVLRIPWFEPDGTWEATDIGKAYLHALAVAQERLRHIGTLYCQWQFHFMRYKHGLLLALRFGQFTDPDKTQEFISRKKGALSGFPVAFDCGSVSEALNDSPARGLIIPDIGPQSEDVKWNAAHLAAERNLLRHVFPPGSVEPDIGTFEEAASYISQMQLVLIENRGAELRPDDEHSYYMPDDNPAAHLRVARRAKAATTNATPEESSSGPPKVPPTSPP